MTFSYSISETTDRDQVRGKIGDTDADTYEIDDETIDAIMALYPSVIATSVECVKRMIAKLSRKSFDRSALGLSTSRGAVLGQLRDLLEDLEIELRSSAGGMFVGGVSQSDVDTQEADTDFIQPSFSVGKNDFPGT